MPANSPPLSPASGDALLEIGRAIRARRKSLGINATAAAEASGISRVTLHRIEKGEPSVTLGAYAAACAALALDLAVVPREAANPPVAAGRAGWIPAKVRVADYPRLAELAWQLQADAELTPREALDIYERNAKHLDAATLGADEKDLLDALRLALRHV